MATFGIAVAVYCYLRFVAEKFDKNGFSFILISTVLLWVIPYGFVLLLPLGILFSLSSPAARSEWEDNKKSRIVSTIIILFVMISFAFYPVSVPQGPSDWGEPISEENPYAPAWPASEQYTWFYDEAVISLVNVRTPHTYSEFGQASFSVNMAIVLGIHEQRMQQSIEVMNNLIPPGFSIDSTSFKLVEVSTEGSYQYGDESYFISRFEIKRDGFETTIGTVLVIAIPNFGGEMTVLSITRSTLFSSEDIFEENIVNQYLNSL